MVASAGITIGEKTGWFGALRWRYLASSPLTEDNAFRSPPTSIFNGRVGYRFDNGWRIQLDVLNLLNTKANQITYAYGSLIKTDSLYNLCLPGADRAGRRLPERRDGLRAASGRAIDRQAHDRCGSILVNACRPLLGECVANVIFTGEITLKPSASPARSSDADYLLKIACATSRPCPTSSTTC